MTKQKKAQKTESPINPEDFTYLPGTKFEVDAKLFFQAMQIMPEILDNERTFTNQILPPSGENLEPTVNKIMFVTDLGMQAKDIFNWATSVHMNNIETGVAIPVGSVRPAEPTKPVKPVKPTKPSNVKDITKPGKSN